MKKIYLLPNILILLSALICVFLPFLIALNLSDNSIYQSLSFGLLIYDIVSSFLLIVIELISLKFDRTATKPTLYAAICIFLGILISQTSLFALGFIGVETNDILVKTFDILHYLFSLSFVFFLGMFIYRDYHFKHKPLVHYIVFPSLFGLFLLFRLLDIYYGYLVITILSVIYVFALSFPFFKNIRTKDNPVPGLISVIIINFYVIGTLFSVLNEGFNCLLGMQGLFVFLVDTGYLLVYLHFIVSKTNKSYALEDKINEINAEKPHKLHISCFQCFDVYYDDLHLVFPSKKSKELFALLVILHGKSLTMDKAIAYLWPDKDIDKSKGLYRNAVMKLRKYFKTVGIDCLSFSRAEIELDISSIDCDYYDVIDKTKPYNGSPLMPEYDWSLEFENILKS